METTSIEVRDPRWKGLYQLGGAAALSLVSIILIQLVVFITVPPPLEGTAADWFELFQSRPLIGLLDFELLMIVYTILSIPLALALYVLLRGQSEAWMALVLILGVLGTMCFIVARPAFEMLYLSNQYAAAATEVQRAMFLAAGEAKLATFHGTAFLISYTLGSINGLILSLVMLRGNLFSKATAYVRIASSVFDFGIYVPGLGILLSIFAVLLLLAWDIMVARRLFQLARACSSQSTPAPVQLPAA